MCLLSLYKLNGWSEQKFDFTDSSWNLFPYPSKLSAVLKLSCACWCSMSRVWIHGDFFFFFRLPSRFVLFFHKFYSLTGSFSRVSNCQKSLIRYCGSVYIIPKFIVKTIFWVFSCRRDGDVIKYPLWIFEISSLILKCLIIAVIVVKNLHKIYIYNVLYYT